MATVLLAIGDASLREAVRAQLEAAGHAPVLLERPLASLSLSRKLSWDAACLDSSTLGIDTLKALSAGRQTAPLIGLGLVDAALSASLSLPLAASELNAAIAAMVSPRVPASDSVLRLDTGQRLAIADGLEVTLTRTEFRLLEVLYERRPNDVALLDVLQAVWGFTEGRGASELVRAHIRNLRLKLAKIGLPNAIRSRRGQGYALIV